MPDETVQRSSTKENTSVRLDERDRWTLDNIPRGKKGYSAILSAGLDALLFVTKRYPLLSTRPPRRHGPTRPTTVKLSPKALEILVHLQMHFKEDPPSIFRRGIHVLYANDSLARVFLCRLNPVDAKLIEHAARPQRRPLKFTRGELTDKLIERLKTNPADLDMRKFAMLTNNGDDMVFGLAGLILDESGVIMDFENGIAAGLMGYEERMEFDLLAHEEEEALALARRQLMPHPKWINYDVTIVRGRHGLATTPLDVMIPAAAREIWAAEHGERAALQLPLYAADWPVPDDQITAETICEYLMAVKCGRYKPSTARERSRTVARQAHPGSAPRRRRLSQRHGAPLGS
jgi:hypothetical protein